MYSICNVVCGFEIPQKIDSLIRELNYEYEDLGYDSYYSGSGDTPRFCGIELFSFDECEKMPAKKLIPKLTPSQDQLNQALAKMENAKTKFTELCDVPENEITPKDKKELLKLFPEKPETFLLWSTS